MRAMVRASSCWTCHAAVARAATPTTSAAAVNPVTRSRKLRMFDLLQLGPEGRLGLGDAEHRVVEVLEPAVDLLDVVVVHAGDQLLDRGDARAEAVAQLAVGRGELGRNPG